MARNESLTHKRAARTPPELKKAREYFKEQAILLRPPIYRAAYSDRMAWILVCMAHLFFSPVVKDHAIVENWEPLPRNGTSRLGGTWIGINFSALFWYVRLAEFVC